MRKTFTASAAGSVLLLAACGHSGEFRDANPAAMPTINWPSATTTTTWTTVKAHGSSTLAAPPPAITTTTPQATTTPTTSAVAATVRWVVGFHQWPGLRVGDAFLGETVIKTDRRLRFVVLNSDDPSFQRRAERHRNVRYVERDKEVSIPEQPHDPYHLLPYHDYGRGSDRPLGPAMSFPDAGISGNSKTACVWLLDENDERYHVLWPKGYQAQYSPLAIYDEQRELVWTDGQRFDLVTLGNSTAELWERVPRECRLSNRDAERPDQLIALIQYDQVG